MRWQDRGRLVIVLSSFLFLFGCGGQGASSVSAAGFLDTTQMFSLQDVAGHTVRLETVLKENKVVLINFWATWCPPCREEIPDLIELQNTYKNRSFTVIGGNVAESKEKVARFVEKEGMN